VSVSPEVAEDADVFRHLASCEQERDTRLTESASVLIRDVPATSTSSARCWIRETLASYPGSLMAAATLGSGGCLVGLRGGAVIKATTTGPATDPGLLPAVVYACQRKGLSVSGTVVTLRTGTGHELDVTLHLVP